MNIIQFGDGNFNRGFIDYMYQKCAKDIEINIYSLQSRATGIVSEVLTQQNNQFHILETGWVNEKPEQNVYLIDKVKLAINPYKRWSEFKNVFSNIAIDVVYSNTTEAGIVNLKEPFQVEKACISYPAKLLQILYFQYSNNFSHTIHVLPLELIHQNGTVLQELCYEILAEWKAEQEFVDWVKEHINFVNTLVDRIVSGYPKDFDIDSLNLSFQDKLLTQVEPYYLFGIEGSAELDKHLNLKKWNENVLYTDDLNKIGKLKIELLNAVHTIIANLGQWYGVDTVASAIKHPKIKAYVDYIVNEGIIKSSQDYSVEEGQHFYKQVLDRFNNPYMKHYLKDIRLNNENKVMTRVNPILVRNVSDQNDVVLKKLLSFYIYSYCNDRNTMDDELSFAHVIEAYCKDEKELLLSNRGVNQLFDELKKEIQYENFSL